MATMDWPSVPLAEPGEIVRTALSMVAVAPAEVVAPPVSLMVTLIDLLPAWL